MIIRENLHVYSADPFTTSDYSPADLSKRTYIALIENNISGIPNNPLPVGLDLSRGVRTTAYTLFFDLPDDAFYINKHHHIAMRNAPVTHDGNLDMCFILCEHAGVSTNRDEAISTAIGGKFMLHLPGGAVREIVPEKIVEGLVWSHE